MVSALPSVQSESFSQLMPLGIGHAQMLESPHGASKTHTGFEQQYALVTLSPSRQKSSAATGAPAAFTDGQLPYDGRRRMRQER